MGNQENIEIIQTMYEAFGRGDLGTIIEALADDVDWGVETETVVAPWYGPRKGHGGVQSFFEDFGLAVEVSEFTPLTFASNDNEVFSLVRCRATVRSTGRPVELVLHHYFRFAGGKIAYYRGTEDTAQVEAALR
jgi:ketosteroid isomerase-like protein